MKYFSRTIEKEVIAMSAQYPVLTIMGPRQSGKTTLTKYLFPDLPYYNFENPDFRLMVQSDPRSFLNRCPNGAIFDEIQQVPEILSYLQQIVDESSNKLTFILTGSNQFSLINKVTQSLAGRTALLKLLPLAMNELPEINNFTSDQLIHTGFYPGIYSKNLDPYKAYRNYYETYLERDLRQIIHLKDLNLFQKFIRICAGRIGNLFNASSIASEVGVSVATIKSWLSILETSYVIMLLQPYYANVSKRLIKSPKLYFYDVGLASYLLGIEQQSQVARDPLRGALFENMVIMDIVKTRFNNGFDHNLYFYRDSHHYEIDIVLKQGHQLIPIEIKSAQTFHPDFIKGFDSFGKVFGENIKKKYLVYDGEIEQGFKNISIVNYRNLHKTLFQ